jgi:hypothetical protein
MLWLCQPVINVVSGASTLKCMAPKQFSLRSHPSNIDRRPALASRIGKLNAIVGQNRVDRVGNSCNEIIQELF